MRKFKIGDWIEFPKDLREYWGVGRFVKITSVDYNLFSDGSYVIGFVCNYYGRNSDICSGITPNYVVRPYQNRLKLVNKMHTKLGKVLYDVSESS